MSAPPLLECEGVSAGYRDSTGATSIVLRDVTFSAEPGELMVLLGRSGSGKSTLLRVLNRFDDPLSGSVRFRGRSVTEQDPLTLRRQVTLVAQKAVVFEGSVDENLRTRPPGAPMPSSAAIARALTDVDLDPMMLDRPASDLSVGEQHRVCIARALVGEPDVLLLDEPTGALDPTTSSRVADLLSALRASRGLTTLVVTHDANLVGRLRARTMLLEGGTVDPTPSADRVERFLSGDAGNGSCTLGKEP